MNWRFWDRVGHEDCAAIEPLLSLYSDNMTTPAETRRVQAHLPECPGCQQALRWMEATHQVLSSRPALTPPVDLRSRIARAIAEADAAKAPAVKARPVPAPIRPARRPLTLRPALAYGLSLMLFAGVAGDLAWNAAHPPHTQLAVRPVVTPPAPRVAANADPQTSATIDSILGHVNDTLRSALIAPSPTGRHSTVHLPRAFQATHGPAQSPTDQVRELPRFALKPPAKAVPHLSPPLHKATAQVTHLAIKPRPSHPALAPKTALPVPHEDNQQVASAIVPPREETHIPVVTPPSIQVRVGTPTVTHDASQVAARSPSLREELSHAVADLNTRNATLTSRARVVNAATHIAVADFQTDRSGTAAFVSGPIR